MTAVGPPGAPPVWRRLLARRLHRILLALVLLIVAVRVALPSILRRILVDQADRAMVGRIEIDDVDLALLTGGFTLHGLRVFAEDMMPIAAEHEHSPVAGMAPHGASPSAGSHPDLPSPTAAAAAAAPSGDVEPAPHAPSGQTESETPAAEVSPMAGEGPPAAAPLLSVKRLTVDFGFLAFLRKMVEVRHIDLEDVAVSLDRAKDGTLLLPAAVPAAAPAPHAEAPAWGVLIRSVALRNGRIGFRDFAVGDPPQQVEVKVPTLDAGQLELLITESGVEPGKVSLDAGIQDGTLHLEATIATLASGPAYESHLVLTNVPIADSRLHIPKVGWSGLTGRLDADLVHRFESQGVHTLRGTVGLRALDVRVAALDEPALVWRALAIDVADVDFVAQHADISRVALDGARVVTRPAGAEPLPVLRGLLAVAASHDIAKLPIASAAPATSPAATIPIGAPAATAAPSAATAAPSATVDTASARPWTWAVAKMLVTDANVHVIGGDGALDVGVTAEAAPLASAAGTSASVHFTLAPSPGGTIELAGDLALEPLAFDGTLRIEDLLLAPLTQPVATAATRLLKNGVASLDLAIAAGATAKAPPNGARISGTITLADVDIAGEDPTVFALRWKQLMVALGSVTAPGVLAPRNATPPAPIDAAFTTVALVRPELTVTRTAQGIALPAGLGGATAAPAPPVGGRGAATHEAAPAPLPAAAPPVQAEPQPDLQVRADRVTVEKMRVVATDTAVKPFYHSILDPIDLSAADVRWPGPAAKDVKLVAKGLDGAVLTVTGDVAPARTRLVAKLADLPLAPFNPYAASTGYGVAGGTAQLESTIRLGKGTYDTTSRLVLNRLDVRGGEGDALFASQFGMPLSLALSLLTDLQGNIVIDLPIAGDAAGMRTGLATLLGDALARAILNAVTSPLKLIGAVARIGDKPAAVTPQPIAFLAGRDALADGEEQKLAPLASLLASAPGLRLHLRGEASEADRRWLREQALRAKLEKESGVVGSLRHIGERGPRAAVLAALTARAAGTPAEIPAEHQAWFETQVAALNIDDAALQQLAAARAISLQSKLASAQGVDAERVILDDTAAMIPGARSVVAIGLGSPAPRPTEGGAR